MANSVWQATIQNAAGDIVPGAEITVIDEGTGLNAVIFSSKAGAALTNPFNADAGGFAQFYSGPGEYRIAAFDIGTGLTQTFDNWRLGDAGARDVGTATGQLPTADDLDMIGASSNFTSNNLNPNVFGGVAGRIIMASGTRTTPTTSVVFFPQVSGLSGDTPTLSKAGTFELFETDTGVIIESNISTLSRITLSGTSGGQVARVVLTGVAGLVAGKSYELRGETNASIITVNI